MLPTVSIDNPGKAAMLHGRSFSDVALVYQVHFESRDQQLFDAYRSPTLTFASDKVAYNKALEHLNEVYADCQFSNWDGYGAVPISYYTYHKALCFLEALPSHCPFPEVIPEPDGDLALEWRGGHGKKLSVSLNANGRLAILYLPDRLRTTLFWSKMELPKPLLALVELFV